MVFWGAFWGAVLGLLWPGSDEGFQFIAGAVLGALAGLSFRRAVRKEIERSQAVTRVLVPVESVEQASATAPAAESPELRHSRGGGDPGLSSSSATAAGTPPRVPDPVRDDGPQVETTVPPSPAGGGLGWGHGAPTPAAAAASVTIEPEPPAAARPPFTPPPPSPFDTAVARFRDWLLGGNTVVRMGVLVLFVGLAFLAKYAVDHALLPPELRLAAIAAVGIALFAAGVRLRRREGREGYALTLQGAGIAVLYLTVFAAFRLYQLLPPAAAFVALGLVCLFSAVIAVTQNALPLAFIGFAGGYAAPVLVSTGGGNHVALFSYYLLLGVAIAALAWWKAWRPLNLLGFFATFGIATLWGVLRYEPRHLASTEPFLVGFFAVFLVASLFYALRHGQSARRAVDATLVFGTPILALGLQAGLVRHVEYATAFSSLVLGALYLALAAWLLKRRHGDPEVHRWLAECFVALGVGFATLAVPLALEGRWTAAVWAIEGAAIYWMGRRQDRWLARMTGLALQAVAAVLYLASDGAGPARGLPFAQPGFVGGAMLAGAAFALAWWSRPGSPWPQRGGPVALAELEQGLVPVWFGLGFLWVQAALGTEIQRMVIDVNGQADFLFERRVRALLHLLAWVGSAFALHHLALPQRREPWALAAAPAWTVMPAMLFTAFWSLGHAGYALAGWGWAVWAVVIALHLVMLRRLDAGPPAGWWPWVHAGGVWLLVLLGGELLVDAVNRAQLWRTAWGSVVLLASGSAVLMLLSFPTWWKRPPERARWPLDRFAPAYLWIAAAPLAAALAAGALIVTIVSDGNARPLPYVPLLNPTDLAVALALTAAAGWLLRLRAGTLDVPTAMRGPAPAAVLAAIGFVALNTAWLRVAHHYAGVPWNAGALFASFYVQAGLSILWTLVALVLMVAAHRRVQRLPWMLGAALLGLTVLKLFVVDLSNRGGAERIVVFIAVGLLMLVVGWFAPLPPAARAKPEPDLQGAAP